MYSTIQKKKCKHEGCENYPETSMQGYCVKHADAEIKGKIITKRHQQDRNRRNKANLKRKVHLAAREVNGLKSPLKRSNKPIPKISKSMAAKLRVYAPIKKQFLKDNPVCQAKLDWCTVKAIDVHHQLGRNGTRLTDTSYFLAVCRNCHTWIELNPLEAKKRGFSLSRLNK